MAQDHPNILIVFPDEFRQQALGAMGQDPVVTPNLDRFAAEGLVLTCAVSNRPVCSPYRAMLMTGKYPHANGVLTNCNSGTVEYGCYLKETDRCLSDILAECGYSQGYIGKWHLDPPRQPYDHTEGPRGNSGVAWDSYTPPGAGRHGFDFWHAYGCCDDHLHPHYWQGEAPVEDRIDVDDWSVRHEADVAVEYIRNTRGRYRKAGRPFCLMVAHNPPHMPFDQVPPEYLAPYRDRAPEDLFSRPNADLAADTPAARSARQHVRNYFAAVTGIDDQFGRILQALRDEGLQDDTIVIFTSDHGEMMGSQGRMYKVVWYDESLLVPFLIRWPGRIAPGRDDLLLSTPDLLPTLLRMAGLGERIPADVQGQDLSAALLGRGGPRPTSALYLDVDPGRPAGGKRGLRTHRYTFVVIREERGAEEVLLYDNVEDPYQRTNVAADRPRAVAELTAEMNDWLARTGDPWLSGI